MPSKTPAQARLMAGVAHDPDFAKKVGIPQSVGMDFNQADMMSHAKGHKTKTNNFTGYTRNVGRPKKGA